MLTAKLADAVFKRLLRKTLLKYGDNVVQESFRSSATLRHGSAPISGAFRTTSGDASRKASGDPVADLLCPVQAARPRHHSKIVARVTAAQALRRRSTKPEGRHSTRAGYSDRD